MRTLSTLVVLALLSTATLSAAPPAGAFHANDWVAVHTASVVGGESAAARVALGAGRLAVDIDGEGPLTGPQGSVGVAILDDAGRRQGGATFTRLGSPDRVIVTVLPAEGGDAAGAGDVDVVARTSEDDASCSFVCFGITTPSRPAGEYGFVVWAAGVARGTFTLRAEGGGAFVAEARGTAYTFGDYSFESGSPNAQAQIPLPVARVGAKAMHDARLPLEVARSLHGVWYSTDFKTLCQFVAGTCVYRHTVTNVCLNDLRTNCDTTRLSWDGPTGGGSGRYIYSFDGAPAGDYSFAVDLKVDAYGPRQYEPNTGTFAYLGENYSILTLADVSVP